MRLVSVHCLLLLALGCGLGCGGDTEPVVPIDAAVTLDAPPAPDLTGVWLFDTFSCGGPFVGIPEYVSEYHIEATTARRIIEKTGCRGEVTGIPRSQSNGVVRLSEELATNVICNPDPCSVVHEAQTFVCPGDFPVGNIWTVELGEDDVMRTTDRECTFAWTRAP